MYLITSYKDDKNLTFSNLNVMLTLHTFLVLKESLSCEKGHTTKNKTVLQNVRQSEHNMKITQKYVVLAFPARWARNARPPASITG